MQFLADILKEMSKKQMISKQDLYIYSEQEIIEKIKHCGDSRIEKTFRKFQKATKVYESDEPVEGKYCVSIDTKRRYIIPLVKTENENIRINKLSKVTDERIKDFFKFDTKKYIYFDFNF